jgi:predicted HicB family RNase H-like nuclease
MAKQQPKNKTQQPDKQQYMNLRIKPAAHRALKTYAAQRGLSMSDAIKDLVAKAGLLV